MGDKLGDRIIAEEARDITSKICMVDHILEKAYSSIRVNARNGENDTTVYVGNCTMYDLRQVIYQLEVKDKYVVKLRNAGLFSKKVTKYTNIEIEW